VHVFPIDEKPIHGFEFVFLARIEALRHGREA
jgi:hypothetical protein